MKLRKLEKEEHGRTRELWEKIFTEDSKEFLDYYYTIKAGDNEIYVIEDGDHIVSMLHLNPYQMRIGQAIYQTHYIVAVATDVEYRRRGLMAKLLEQALQDMKQEGEPFTFLMPANEEIYKPFGFTFLYQQPQGRFCGKPYKDKQFSLATREDCADIAEFANRFLSEYDIVTWRDAAYYQTLLAEQESERGGILLLKENQTITGVFCFAKGETNELREPLCGSREDLECAIYYLTGNEIEEVRCIGYGHEKKPMIMVKVLDENKIKTTLESKAFINEIV